MDERRFDRLSRVAGASRRSVVAALAAAVGAELASRLGIGDDAFVTPGAEAKQKCEGCRRDGKCQPGITFAECGLDGEPCRNCRDAFKECDRRGTRDGGRCICTERSCGRKGGDGGCCTKLGAAQGACKTGAADNACGKRGEQCIDCTEQSKKCDPATRTCCIAKDERGCGQNDPCCDGLQCINKRCRESGGPCRHAGEACSAANKCCESSEVLECRNGTCCALKFGVCRLNTDSDCCDPTHSCLGTNCQ